MQTILEIVACYWISFLCGVVFGAIVMACFLEFVDKKLEDLL